MKLYHGTSAAHVEGILRDGLLNRQETEHCGNWEHSVDSAEDCVYLTDTYAVYFAYAATDVSEKIALIEVDTELLDTDNLLPDEDFMEQITRGSKAGQVDEEYDALETMEERTVWMREHLHWWPHLWGKSIEHLGTCCYVGSIPPEAITKVVVIDPKQQPLVMMLGMDAMIMLLNHQIMSGKYKALINHVMGYEADPAALSGVPSAFGNIKGGETEHFNAVWAEQLERVKKLMEIRDGLEVVFER